MDCTFGTWLSNEEYLQRLYQETGRRRIPISGSMDLTSRCNLRCVHCYMGPNDSVEDWYHKELNTSAVLRILDEVTEAGCLNLLLTGGEPLLRPDFDAIYRHAKSNGLLVTVFTNGTVVSDATVSLFQDLPPMHVEVTLYGAGAETYERITGVRGSHARCISGIERMLEGGIRLKLKTMLMTLNRHEFEDMKRLADSFGVPFRFDPALFPRFNGDTFPVRLRVPPEEAWAREASDEVLTARWREYFDRMKDLPVSDRLYQCGAGLNYFHVDAFGRLKPCLMTRGVEYDLLSGSFQEGWDKEIARIRELPAGPAYPCNSCEKRTLCGSCPAFFALENGSEQKVSDYICELCRLRFEAIGKDLANEVVYNDKKQEIQYQEDLRQAQAQNN